MSSVAQRQELFVLGSVINNAVSEPENLKKLLPRPQAPQASGMIAIPKKRKREHG